MANTYRLKGQLPKIGIRPTIDGRREGVRESLEDQTMSMAKFIQYLYGFIFFLFVYFLYYHLNFYYAIYLYVILIIYLKIFIFLLSPV